jgi:hypothetical protein
MSRASRLIRASSVIPWLGLAACSGAGRSPAPGADPVAAERPGAQARGQGSPSAQAPDAVDTSARRAPAGVGLPASEPFAREDAGPPASGDAGLEPADAAARDAPDGGVDAPGDAGLDAGDGTPVSPGPGELLPEQRVVPLFITATDEDRADTARYVATYDSIIAGVRTWYTEQLESLGDVRFYHEPVRVLRGNYTRAEWDRFGTGGFEYPDGSKSEAGGGCSMYYGALHELTTNGLLERAGLPQPGTSGIVYYAILGGGTNGSCGSGGFLAASELQLLLLAEQSCPEGRLVDGAVDCAPVGAIAHELGHGFGLPHTSERPSCAGTPSVMEEWWLYDGVGLCIDERADLMRSGYLYTP